MSEVVFGSLLPIYYYEIGDLSAAIEFVNAREKPLALYVFSTTTSTKVRVVDKTSSGSIVINDTMVQLSNLHVSFGGVGNSGMGAHHGRHGLEVFSHRKAMIYSLLDLPQRYPPYSTVSERVLRIVQYPVSVVQMRMALLLLLAVGIAIVATAVGKA